MSARWIVVPIYDPQGYPPISGREAHVRVAAIQAVEQYAKLPNPKVAGGVEITEYGARIKFPGGVVLTNLSAATVVAMIEAALASPEGAF